MFAAEQPAADEIWEQFFAGVGAMACGSTTYEWLVEHENLLDNPAHWQEMHGDRKMWVFTHRELPVVPGADLRFVRDDVATVHAEMVSAAGDRNVWIIGGGDLVGQFDDVGLLDEMILGVAPVTLGAGAPVLPRRIERRLQLTEARSSGGFAFLTYAVSRRSEV
ncbi:dihydrofolate reductase family protein [Solicola gregarius]|uniref:Dihydrofolate reductase family protein n=1 Tax=Solicola gregarius TaxID=2908642 RepID=A0AA46TL46_9ACTN|nr:dihydrofolate reductase family protein [Solicola gregarius]UYM07270.1 dihydrofolate reductase family protein [Solicola gregarius]